MPIFVEMRRGDPEQGFMSFINTTEVSSAGTALTIGEPVFHDVGSGTGYDGVSTDDDGHPAGDIGHHIGPSVNATPFGESGLATIWGYHGAIAKATGTAWVAGTSWIVTSALGTNTYTVLAWDAVWAGRGYNCGVALAAAASGDTTGVGFVKAMGV